MSAEPINFAGEVSHNFKVGDLVSCFWSDDMGIIRSDDMGIIRSDDMGIILRIEKSVQFPDWPPHDIISVLLFGRVVELLAQDLELISA